VRSGLFLRPPAHAVVHISDTGLLMARTVLFSIAWAAFLVYAVALLLHAF
jgi:hypothetical protein